MTQFRRDALSNVSVATDTHVGLWLDKYLKDDNKGGDKQKSAKGILVDEVAHINPPDSYKSFFTRWQKALEDVGAECREAKTQGRLAINLGAEGVLETSIALHRTYGVPYIPGSALKGLASHYILKYQDNDEWKDASKILFGDTESAGYVNFYDALYIPGSGHLGRALWTDIITVHHPKYYQGDEPPADWDSPKPIPFLTATGTFLISLSGPEQWVKAAFEILTLALAREGIGAKTSSGYGRMNFSQAAGEPYAAAKRRLLSETPPLGRLRGTVSSIDGSERHGQVNPAKGGAQVFVHVNQIKSGEAVLRVGQIVEYRIGKNDKGKDQAQEVVILLQPEN